MNEMSESYEKCLDLLKEKKFVQALANFDEHEKRFGQSSADYILLRLKFNQAQCLFEILKRHLEFADAARFEVEIANYLAILAGVNKKAIAPPPTLACYSLVIQFCLSYCSHDEMPDKVSNYHDRFFENTRFGHDGDEFIGLRDFFEVWMIELNNQRFILDMPDSFKRIKILGRTMLHKIPAQPEFSQLRVRLNNFMADTVHFAPETGHGEEEAYFEVRSYLDASLTEKPDDCFARTFKEYINKNASTSLQIRRFNHDTATRTGNILDLLKKIVAKSDQNAELRQLCLSLEREINLLTSIGDLIIKSLPAGSDWAKVDIAAFLREILEARGILPESVRFVGEPKVWEISVPYTTIVVENLVKNSLEAYSSKGIDRSQQKLEIMVDYDRKTVEYKDFAGGIPPEIRRKIFDPYFSTKKHEVKMNFGLGMTAALEAMTLQDGSISLKEEQPAGGACFIIKFR